MALCDSPLNLAPSAPLVGSAFSCHPLTDLDLSDLIPPDGTGGRSRAAMPAENRWHGPRQ